MTDQTKSQILTETLKNNHLKDLATDISELILDNFTNNNSFAKEIPIIKTLLNIKNGASQIKETLFLKKIIAFLFESKKIKTSARKAMIEKIDKSDCHRMKVGEKLLYIIDRIDDWEMARIISLYFNEFLKGKVLYEDFIKIAKIIESLTVYDLQKFLEFTTNNAETYFTINNYGETNGIPELINSGLFTYHIDEVGVEDEDDWKMERKYKTNGGELVASISPLGTIIKNVLKEDKIFS